MVIIESIICLDVWTLVLSTCMINLVFVLGLQVRLNSFCLSRCDQYFECLLLSNYTNVCHIPLPYPRFWYISKQVWHISALREKFFTIFATRFNATSVSIVQTPLTSFPSRYQLVFESWGVLIEGIMIPLNVLTWAVLTWVVVNNFFVSVASQCYTTPRVQQKPADKTTYETDVIDLREILVSVLRYSVIIQDEFWGTYGTNLTLTYPKDCLLYTSPSPRDLP